MGTESIRPFRLHIPSFSDLPSRKRTTYCTLSLCNTVLLTLPFRGARGCGSQRIMGIVNIGAIDHSQSCYILRNKPFLYWKEKKAYLLGSQKARRPRYQHLSYPNPRKGLGMEALGTRLRATLVEISEMAHYVQDRSRLIA